MKHTLVIILYILNSGFFFLEAINGTSLNDPLGDSITTLNELAHHVEALESLVDDPEHSAEAFNEVAQLQNELTAVTHFMPPHIQLQIAIAGIRFRLRAIQSIGIENLREWTEKLDDLLPSFHQLAPRRQGGFIYALYLFRDILSTLQTTVQRPTRRELSKIQEIQAHLDHIRTVLLLR